ncbi:MAG: tripartite tricarboxylate transporter substrate binding protein [Herminiimonas sp.]|jgi:tripartite-type tricarboxylate transporter receptor subunit TctC|nr:tripartite tricarboxylate transporter substrate binding protein [Herminiimonas sp.]
MHRRFIVKLAAAVLPLLATCSTAFAQNYPNKTITLVAPFAPGGALDLIARTMAQKLQEDLGQSVVVDNKAGAAGIIGTQYVAKAAPDGYTLLLGATTTHGINPSLYTKLPYNAATDFAPISLIATIPHLLVVNPNLPVKNLGEFIRYARTKPLTFGSAGIGAPHHLAGEILKTEAKLDMQHIPYKGTGPAMLAVMSGEIDFMSVEIAAAMPHIKAGKLRPLAVAAPKRVPSIDLATFAEQGIPGFEVTSWFAIFAPKNTPRDIVAKLNASLVKAVATDDVKSKFTTLGALPIGSSPDELRAYVDTEIVRWAAAVKSSGTKAD